ncbi:hypothetical protein AVEN_52914-1 [Araneus ventricosus]|uniref:Peptidase aspartic putative domain-containing protein n=1 Tax=Araneus ventricosus TaxID=182803 RepID=A0A4Y2FF61_ARAVE|nr:hypothetical protein AVEN_52914-1 [Araneus ventricosus]
MTSETEITTLNRKRGNIKSHITKLANALVDKTEHSIPKLQAQLDVLSKLQEKFELLKNDYYKITNQTEFAEVEFSLDSVEDDLLNLELADPTFFIPQKVDLLLRAELFFAFLEKDKIKIGNNLFLQSSCFGYLVSGNISDDNFDSSTKYCFLTKNLQALNKTLTNFWEIEDVDSQKTCNSEELNYCYEHCAKTHFRKADGKYVVPMSLKPEFPETMLGNSNMIASKRLDLLWTRLERDPTMKALYSDFLNEYESWNHMEEVKEDTDLDAGCYLPHHGILRPDNKTTRLRVVFNASSKTSSGYSLNDLLYKGGVLHEDLFSILIRFRKHTYAFTADIKQMFRMIELNESQTRLQDILWKNRKSSPTKVYELRTVTYETASAPYLATKVLQQLGLDEEKNFPLASKVLLQVFYMDNCL